MITIKSPSWLRVLQIGLGAISIILSIVILAFPGIAIYTIILMLSVVLLIIGIERIAIGIASSSPPPSPNKSSRFANIGLGALVIVLAIVVMSYPLHTAAFLIFLGAFALLFNGIARIVQGIANKNAPRWSRSFLVGVGALSIAVSALVMVHPISIGVVLLALVISISLLINGIQMIASGIAGKQRYAKSQVSIFHNRQRTISKGTFTINFLRRVLTSLSCLLLSLEIAVKRFVSGYTNYNMKMQRDFKGYK
jgi:uncharacterized membrane protein HdeD (DUF308 family)